MKLFKCAIPLVLIVFTFSSCSSSGGMKKNQLSVKKNAVTYYLGKYTGNEKDCFPPITNRICSLQSSYEIIQQLDMELFTFELQGPSDISDEPLYLAASELALQRGYASFTVLGGSNFSSCVSLGTQAKTYGNYTPNLTGGGRYSGTTRIQNSGTCLFKKSMKVLYFKNKSDLEKGVLMIAPYWNNKEIHPVSQLYFGTTPKLKFSKFNYIGYKTIYYTTKDAWKTHYNAQGLSNSLHQKLGITESKTIHFINETDQKKKDLEKDVIGKWRTIDP